MSAATPTPAKTMSARLGLYGAVAIAAAVVVALFFVNVFGLHTLSGMRAFVEGEGLWTKHQRDAVQSLTQYTHTRDEAEYQEFLAHLTVLEAVERTRLELEEPTPDMDVVRDGFVKLGVAPRDIDDMVNVYRRFHDVDHVRRTIAAWAAADAAIDDLQVLGSRVRERVGRQPNAEASVQQELAQISEVSARLNDKEHEFSASLGAASHWALSVLIWVMLAFTVAAGAILGGLFIGGNRLLEASEGTAKGLEEQAWVRTGVSALYEKTEEVETEEDVSEVIVREVCAHLGAKVGALFVLAGDELVARGGYAVEASLSTLRFSLGEGLLGQVAKDDEILVVTDLPDDHIRVASGLGDSSPRRLVLSPTRFEGRVNGVIELALSDEPDNKETDYLEQASLVMGVAVAAAQTRAQLHELLAQTQNQAEELQAQQEELRQANEELEERARDLERSGSKLEEQQAELEAVNAELEERTEAQQREARALKETRDELQKKATDLEEMSRYKSEFLANMSHELRTPLNSILLLSRVLSENKSATLTEKEVQYANTIHDSGEELIALIDEILDQARIESGRLQLNVERVVLRDVIASIENQIRPTAEDKGLEFHTSVSSGVPKTVGTDEKRVRQILKNLLSNAIKFTESGHVHLLARPASEAELPTALRESKADFVALSVQDSGIGIPVDKQEIIFEAFRQADGSTGRKFGGTGLGLAISHTLAGLLGGELVVNSVTGSGSTFTLFIPASESGERVASSSVPASRYGKASDEQEVVDSVSEQAESVAAPESSTSPEPESPEPESPEPESPAPKSPEPAPTSASPLPDDREDLDEGARVVLIIEDDPRFASILVDLARERSFKVLHACTGKDGLSLARRYRPQAVLLDIGLPDMDGMTVISRLKDDLALRHIPVHIISAHERNLDALRMGAAGFLRKPVSLQQVTAAFARIESLLDRPVSRLLVAIADEAEGRAIAEKIGGDDVELELVSTGTRALEALRGGGYDCAVVEWSLPDMPGKNVLLGVRETPGVSHVPVIILSSETIDGSDHLMIDRYADRLVVKDEAASARLLDETTLFLHRVQGSLPPEQRKVIHRLHDREALFKGKKLLVVDDDMRNVFALTAILESEGFELTVARNGVEALEKLEKGSRPDLILMDIMMPEMDGYEAMRRIRAQEEFAKTPIVALTAKAMKGDRAKCIEAGASDYMTKPVDDQKLLSLLRVWLYR